MWSKSTNRITTRREMMAASITFESYESMVWMKWLTGLVVVVVVIVVWAGDSGGGVIIAWLLS